MGLPNEELVRRKAAGRSWVGGAGGGRWREKRGRDRLRQTGLWKCCIMRSSAAGRAEHSASIGAGLSLPPDSRGHASRRDLASERTLGKSAKCRFRFFPRLPAKLSVLPDKQSCVHNCKFHCRDPSAANKHVARSGPPPLPARHAVFAAAFFGVVLAAPWANLARFYG